MTAEQTTIVLNWLLSAGFPLLVGLVTTKETNPLSKALLLAGISVASGFVSQLVAALVKDLPFNVWDALLTGAVAWLLAVTSHKELWTRTNLIDLVQSIGIKPKATGAKHSA